MVFLLFGINGPAIGLVGQLRLSELAILTVGLLNVTPVLRSVGKTERRLGLLFVLSAFTYLFMDAFNQGIDNSTIARFGTYVILCALLFSVNWIIGDSKTRLVAALAGFSASFLVVLVLKLPVPSANFHLVPWRLGLGAAVTFLLCSAIFYFPRYHALGLAGLFFLIGSHLLFNSRNLALVTLIVFFVALWTYMLGVRIPDTSGLRHRARFLTYGAVAVFSLYALIQFVVALSILPDDMQRKFEVQLQNSYGLVAAARPDVATAVYGIAQRPLTGFGSSTVDPDVYEFYARVASANFLFSEYQRYQFLLEQETRHGTPSHSHIFGAWVDAGVIAAVSWMAVLLLCARILGQIIRYRSAITPLATFVAVSLSWSVLFSPGPIRLEVALSIAVLLFVDRHIAQERRTRELLWRQSAHRHGGRDRCGCASV